jgi:hypothetical protein
MLGGVISKPPEEKPSKRRVGNVEHRITNRCRRQKWFFSQKYSTMDCNQALTWMVVVRDPADFEQRYPSLKIDMFELIPWLTYMSWRAA